MKTALLLVGKTTNKHFEAIIDDYKQRIEHYLPFEVIVIPELKNTRNNSVLQQKEREGELILTRCLPTDYVVLLDEKGTEMRSIELAHWLEKKQAGTAKRLIFVIGGPYGFSEQVYKRANEKLSLSKLTLSHQLVRLFFAEQLYRACTIIKGESYHHE